MSICGRARPLATLAALGVSLGVSGCFDVKRVDVTGAAALEVDSFEDGDQVPTSNKFAGWGCYEFEKAAPPPTCVTTAPGFESKFAEALSFELGAPLDGDPTSVGAGLGVFAPTPAPVDISPWERLRFDAQFEPSNPASPDGTLVWIVLSCTNVFHPNGSVPGGWQLEQSVAVGQAWSRVSAQWADFGQPGFQQISISAADCLAVVDGVQFQIRLTDGQPGTLRIDNVFLE